MLVQQTERQSVRAYGQAVKLGSDPWQRLNYYLKLMTDWPNLDRHVPARFQKSGTTETARQQSTSELKEMVGICRALSPQKLRELGYFAMVDDRTAGELFPGYNNEFFEIMQVKKIALAGVFGSAIAAAAREAKSSLKIMVYKERWEDENFYDPLNAIIRMINAREGSAADPDPARLLLAALLLAGI
jgi:hypothetical protein